MKGYIILACAFLLLLNFFGLAVAIAAVGWFLAGALLVLITIHSKPGGEEVLKRL